MGHSGSLGVLNKQQSTSSLVSRNTRKFNASVDDILPNAKDSTSIFSKVLGQELSGSLSNNIYLRCWMDFTSNVIGTKAPNIVNLGLSDVNLFVEFNAFGTPDTRVRRPTDVSHWSTPGHVFLEATLVRMSGTRSELNYSYKTNFGIRRENQDFGRRNNLMSQPPLESPRFGTNTTNITTSPIDLIPVGRKTPDPTPQKHLTNFSTQPTDYSKRKVKVHVRLIIE